jgi:type IX secretion system PorP/SprF family membrane protein
MKKIYYTVAFAFLFVVSAKAQQDPNYTQYMYNMNVVNPAYAGSNDGVSGGLLYRAQWVDIEGAPRTGTFNIHSPVGKNVGLGLSAITDQIGPVDATSVNADFSYTLNLGGEHKLALGLKAGVNFHKVGLFNDIANGYLPQQNDVAFRENSSNTYFNFGSGLFYYTDKYYVALSVPGFLKTTYLHLQDDGSRRQFGSNVQHYFLTGGYIFDLSETVRMKPSFMFKSSFGTSASIDGSLNFLFFDKFEIGATYRLDDSFGAMVNYAISPSLRIGYAYDHVISDLNVTTPASHEIMLLFDLSFRKRVSVSPRFF